MPGNIFISYRRRESIKDARALYERLSRDFGAQRIFVDLAGIDPGDDFVVSLDGQLAECEVLLVLMSSNWVAATDDKGARRLDDPNDFVRIEVCAALKRQIKVFPVLIDGAQTPRAEDLPEDLRPLVRRQALSLDYAKFDGDVERLSKAIRKAMEADHVLPEPPAPPPPEPPPVAPPRTPGRGLPGAARAGLWIAGLLVAGLLVSLAAGGYPTQWLKVALSDVKYPPLRQDVRVGAEDTIKHLVVAVRNQFGRMAARDIPPWELAQDSLAVPRSNLIAPEAFTAYVRANAHPACSCWTELLDKPDDGKGVFISGWVLAALARYGVPATPAELHFLLDGQHADGWWPIFPVADAPAFASSYATAWAILGLHQQRVRMLVPAQDAAAVDKAIDKGAAWLLSVRAGARWKFYPLDPASKVSVSVSGTVLHALHAVDAPGLAPVDLAWLDTLPRDVVDQSETEYRVVPTTPVASTNAIEMITLPWALVATAEAYPRGSTLQRVNALRWMEDALSDPRVTHAAEKEKRSWWLAELLLALRTALP